MDISILLVDDEPANILLLSKILSLNGYTNVTTTIESRDAAVLHKEHNYELILLDINMPELNGYEVLEQLQSLDNFPTTKVIATSGDVSLDDIDKALDAGFDSYLTKPMKINDIMNVINKVLKSKSL